MVKYTIYNQKQGPGEKTATINLGAALNRRAKNVLLIDLDPQGNLCYSLGINEFEQSLGDALLGEVSLEAIMQEQEGLNILPSDNGLADTEISVARTLDQETV